MAKKWPGGIITKNQATPTGPYQDSSAPGIWTLNQMSYWVKQALWPTAGNVNPNAFIENLFSTWLYAGAGSTQTIINGINLSANGGMTWIKSRTGAFNNVLFDSNRTGQYLLISNTTGAQRNEGGSVWNRTTTGFSILNDGASNEYNNTGQNYVSWTFRKQPKFFGIVTYTGNGNTSQTVAHSLGSVPGCMIVKQLTAGAWTVYHRSLGATKYLTLNSTVAEATATNRWNDTTPTSTSFTVGSQINQVGESYVAYLFAHDAGGFGLSGTDNVISCGNYTGNGSTAGPTITLGWEPQWILVKRYSAAGTNWHIVDNMRGMATIDSNGNALLQPNLTNAESSTNPGGTYFWATPTGFQIKSTDGEVNSSGQTYIYIAIRRGPMQVPTLGTSVFDVGTRSGSGSDAKTNSNVLTDLTFIKNRTSGGEYWAWTPRLNGNLTLQSNSTDANLTGAMTANPWATMTGAFCAASNGATNSGSLVDYSFRRASGFFDVVCYSGNDVSGRTLNHNLTVAPELMIVKIRNGAGNWSVYAAPRGGTEVSYLNNTYGFFGDAGSWANTAPTASVFSVGANGDVNATNQTYVAYLFATVAGVSKVGSYTGTGATLNINAGFTTGARFVMIKRTDSTGSWFVWDTARGMVAGTDPRLALNSTAAESNANWVYTATSGFQIVTTDATVNASGGSYIYLAIA